MGFRLKLGIRALWPAAAGGTQSSTWAVKSTSIHG